MSFLEKDLAEKAANQSLNECEQSQNIHLSVQQQPLLPITPVRNKRKRPAESRDKHDVGPTIFPRIQLVTPKVTNLIII
jgi:hypothetical protein